MVARTFAAVVVVMVVVAPLELVRVLLKVRIVRIDAGALQELRVLAVDEEKLLLAEK